MGNALHRSPIWCRLQWRVDEGCKGGGAKYHLGQSRTHWAHFSENIWSSQGWRYEFWDRTSVSQRPLSSAVLCCHQLSMRFSVHLVCLCSLEQNMCSYIYQVNTKTQVIFKPFQVHEEQLFTNMITKLSLKQQMSNYFTSNSECVNRLVEKETVFHLWTLTLYCIAKVLIPASN